MLKDELPKLFELESEFIRPLFQNFYYMQLNIFYTLNEKMKAMEIDYFDFSVGIEDQYEAKRGDVKDRAEALSIVHFKGTGKRRTPPVHILSSSFCIKSDGWEAGTFAGKSKYAIERDREKKSATGNYGTYRPSTNSSEPPPPPYSPPHNGVTPALAAAAAGKKPPPPPPAPKPAGLAAKKEHAVALYDYTAQAEGDLSFRAGDRIEIVQKGQGENEWWVGKLNGKEGQFPANYTRLE